MWLSFKKVNLKILSKEQIPTNGKIFKKGCRSLFLWDQSDGVYQGGYEVISALRPQKLILIKLKRI